MWTIKIHSKTRVGDQLNILVEFNNGTDSFTHTFNFSSNVTLEDVRLAIKRYITRLNELDSVTSSIPTGVVDVSSVSEPTYTPTDREVFTQKVRKLQSAQRAIDLGVIANTNTAYVNLLNSVRADMKAEYIDLF